MLVCETRKGKQRANVSEAENSARVTGRKLDKLHRGKRGEKIKMRVRKTVLMSVRDSETTVWADLKNKCL